MSILDVIPEEYEASVRDTCPRPTVDSVAQIQSGPGGAGNTEIRGLATSKEWLE